MRLLSVKTKTILLAALICVSCGKKKSADSEEDDPTYNEQATSIGVGQSSNDGTSIDVPDVSSINLNALGTGESASLALQGSEPCDKGSLGVFGLALGGACHTAPFAANLMLGSETGDHDGDGDLDCDDFDALEDSDNDSPGILLSLMCQDVFKNTDEIISMSHSNTTKDSAIGISFADIADELTDAVGHWTQGNAGSYPADIRMWANEDSSTLDDATGRIALGLESLTSGQLQLPEFGDMGFAVKATFDKKDDTTDCAASLTRAEALANCHDQNIKIFAVTDDASSTDGPPAGFHLQIFADDVESPTFLVLEGRYEYTAARAEAQWAADFTPLAATRSIYFTTVQNGDQIWGRFEFLDENGDLISWDRGLLGDIALTLAGPGGICLDLGVDEQPDACTDVNGGDYDEMWEGKADFAVMDATPVDVTFGDVPSPAGICTTVGCVVFPEE